jgi:hypothetical protein
MKKRIPVRTHSAGFMALAVLTLLAILVAPICAPLCAASACASRSSQGQCHEMANMIAGGSEQFVAESKACEASDFSAMLVKPDEKPLSLQNVQSNSEVVFFGRSAEKALRSLPVSAADLSVHPFPLQLADSHSMTTILRI